MVYWITGRKNSGKTTYAKALADGFRREGRPVLMLDGDDVRKRIADPGYTDDGRRANIDLVSRIASLAEAQGIIVIVSLISPKAEWRQAARQRFMESKLIYLPGGSLWQGSAYEEPTEEEDAQCLIRTDSSMS